MLNIIEHTHTIIDLHVRSNCRSLLYIRLPHALLALQVYFIESIFLVGTNVRMYVVTRPLYSPPVSDERALFVKSVPFCCQ